MISAIRTFIRVGLANVQNKTSPVFVTEAEFKRLVQLVIDGIEGGYYHPNIKVWMSPADQKIMGESGETMYGLDRKWGADPLATYPEWATFWAIIDAAGASTRWRHYFMGPADLQPQLKELAAKIMYRWFCELSSKYITPEAASVISSDPRLVLHFAYACWNGRGDFIRYAIALNDAVKKYAPSKEAIFTAAFAARKNSKNVVKQRQAVNLEKVFLQL